MATSGGPLSKRPSNKVEQHGRYKTIKVPVRGERSVLAGFLLAVVTGTAFAILQWLLGVSFWRGLFITVLIFAVTWIWHWKHEGTYIGQVPFSLGFLYFAAGIAITLAASGGLTTPTTEVAGDVLDAEDVAGDVLDVEETAEQTDTTATTTSTSAAPQTTTASVATSLTPSTAPPCDTTPLTLAEWPAGVDIVRLNETGCARFVAEHQTAGERHSYAADLEAGDRFSFNFRWVSDFNAPCTHVRIIHPDGRELSSHSICPPNNLDRPSEAFEVDIAGRYTVIVERGDNSDTGAYVLGLFDVS